jgi:hypothetical protein
VISPGSRREDSVEVEAGFVVLQFDHFLLGSSSECLCGKDAVSFPFSLFYKRKKPNMNK